MAEASSAVMAGIAEALIATAVGLLVAIPAVIAFNVFKGRVRASVTDCQMLARILLAHLKAVDLPARQREAAE
jgi:biopolymer transport protein ExbB